MAPKAHFSNTLGERRKPVSARRDRAVGAYAQRSAAGVGARSRFVVRGRVVTSWIATGSLSSWCHRRAAGARGRVDRSRALQRVPATSAASRSSRSAAMRSRAASVCLPVRRAWSETADTRSCSSRSARCTPSESAHWPLRPAPWPRRLELPCPREQCRVARMPRALARVVLFRGTCDPRSCRSCPSR